MDDVGISRRNLRHLARIETGDVTTARDGDDKRVSLPSADAGGVCHPRPPSSSRDAAGGTRGRSLPAILPSPAQDESLKSRWVSTDQHSPLVYRKSGTF